jgi:hypothetical protein
LVAHDSAPPLKICEAITNWTAYFGFRKAEGFLQFGTLTSSDRSEELETEIRILVKGKKETRTRIKESTPYTA